MFGIGGTELLVIFVVALIVLGPKSVPQIARTLGKAMGEFRRVSTEFQRTLNTEIELEEREKRAKEDQKPRGDAGAAPQRTPAAENGSGRRPDQQPVQQQRTQQDQRPSEPSEPSDEGKARA